MAIVTICDVCGTILDDDTDEVVIEFKFKASPNRIVKTTKRLHLCGKCYGDKFGTALEDCKKEYIND